MIVNDKSLVAPICIFMATLKFLIFQVILDMSSHYPTLLVRRMLKQHVSKFGVSAFPSLHLIEKEGSFKQLTKLVMIIN